MDGAGTKYLSIVADRVAADRRAADRWRRLHGRAAEEDTVSDERARPEPVRSRAIPLLRRMLLGLG